MTATMKPGTPSQKARLQHVGAQPARRRSQQRCPAARTRRPAAEHRAGLDAAEAPDPLELIGEIAVAVVLEVARQRARRARRPRRGRAGSWPPQRPAAAPEHAQLPVGMEVSVPDPAAEVERDAVELEAVDAVVRARRGARAGGAASRAESASSASRATTQSPSPGPGRSSSARRFPRRGAARPARRSAERSPRWHRRCARRPPPRTRPTQASEARQRRMWRSSSRAITQALIAARHVAHALDDEHALDAPDLLHDGVQRDRRP